MAQQVTASLRGALTGGNGETVPGAHVRLTNTRTGSVLDTTTTDAGTFGLTGLDIGGPYTIKVDASRLLDQTVTGIYLQLARPRTSKSR